VLVYAGGTTDLHSLEDCDPLEHLVGGVGRWTASVAVSFLSCRLKNNNNNNTVAKWVELHGKVLVPRSKKKQNINFHH